MKRIAAVVTVAVPASLCFRACQDAYADDRWREAYRTLRPGREYSGRVTASEPDRRLEITVAGLDPATGAQMSAFGYRVTYDFTPEDQARTHVEVGVEYELLAAVGAMGTLEGQAGNEILHRLAGLLALEAGVRAGATV
jgi:hypothetical protein